MLAAIEALEALEQGPIYTIASVNGGCGVWTGNVLHEMLEAATDPYPPVSTVFSGSGEIADMCKGGTPASPFVPPIASIPIVSGGQTLYNPFVTTSIVAAPQYWSIDRQKCLTGFENQPAPSSPLAISVKSGHGPTLALSITGSGFGTLPNSSSTQGHVSLPYIAIQDQLPATLTPNWQAGNSLNSDLLGVTVSSWTDSEIEIQGIGSVGTDFTMQSTDLVSLWICNPASGGCAAGNVNLPPGPTEPNLAIALSIAQPELNAPNVVVYLDGKSLGSLGNGQATPWIAATVGAHRVTTTTSSLYTVYYGGDCSSSGTVNLSDGQNANCVVSVINSSSVDTSGCPPNTRCCGSGKGKCLQCVPNNALCP